MITKALVEKALEEVAKEVDASTISKKNLRKFTDSEYDKRLYEFLQGTTGYYQKGLPLLINKLQCKNIVELGSREGVSTLCIWDKLADDARFTTIDILRDQRYCPEEMFEDSRVKFIFGDVSDLSIFKEELPLDIDFLFSDTVHCDRQISDEFEIYQHFLSDVALVGIDDIHLNDKHKFFERIPYTKWDLTKLFHISGWGLFLYERKEPLTKEERILRAYKASAMVWKRKADDTEKALQKMDSRRPITILKNVIKKITPLYSLLTFIYNTYYGFMVKRKKGNKAFLKK